LWLNHRAKFWRRSYTRLRRAIVAARFRFCCGRSRYNMPLITTTLYRSPEMNPGNEIPSCSKNLHNILLPGLGYKAIRILCCPCFDPTDRQLLLLLLLLLILFWRYQNSGLRLEAELFLNSNCRMFWIINLSVIATRYLTNRKVEQLTTVRCRLNVSFPVNSATYNEEQDGISTRLHSTSCCCYNNRSLASYRGAHIQSATRTNLRQFEIQQLVLLPYQLQSNNKRWKTEPRLA